jgi:prolyl-tRNA editing enzyme YbaK/EbsC (Cys-tRNA(Pro) deacylase)
MAHDASGAAAAGGRARCVKPAAQRVQAILDGLGLERQVVELPVSARTSQEAADAVGVTVAQIAKSLVFTVNGRAVLVIASGANRVDERKLEVLAAGRVRRADAETVRQASGYAIGGVAPVGHPSPMPTWIDEDLFGHDVIYAAAGAPECVFPLTPEELVRITGGQVSDIKDAHRRGAGGTA